MAGGGGKNGLRYDELWEICIPLDGSGSCIGSTEPVLVVMLAAQDDDDCWLLEESKRKENPLNSEVKDPEPCVAVLVTLDPMLVKLKLSLTCWEAPDVFMLLECSMIFSTEYWFFCRLTEPWLKPAPFCEPLKFMFRSQLDWTVEESMIFVLSPLGGVMKLALGREMSGTGKNGGKLDACLGVCDKGGTITCSIMKEFPMCECFCCF